MKAFWAMREIWRDATTRLRLKKESRKLIIEVWTADLKRVESSCSVPLEAMDQLAAEWPKFRQECEE